MEQFIRSIEYCTSEERDKIAQRFFGFHQLSLIDASDNYYIDLSENLSDILPDRHSLLSNTQGSHRISDIPEDLRLLGSELGIERCALYFRALLRIDLAIEDSLGSALGIERCTLYLLAIEDSFQVKRKRCIPGDLPLTRDLRIEKITYKTKRLSLALNAAEDFSIEKMEYYIREIKLMPSHILKVFFSRRSYLGLISSFVQIMCRISRKVTDTFLIKTNFLSWLNENQYLKKDFYDQKNTEIPSFLKRIHPEIPMDLLFKISNVYDQLSLKPSKCFFDGICVASSPFRFECNDDVLIYLFSILFFDLRCLGWSRRHIKIQGDLKCLQSLVDRFKEIPLSSFLAFMNNSEHEAFFFKYFPLNLSMGSNTCFLKDVGHIYMCEISLKKIQVLLGLFAAEPRYAQYLENSVNYSFFRSRRGRVVEILLDTLIYIHLRYFLCPANDKPQELQIFKKMKEALNHLNLQNYKSLHIQMKNTFIHIQEVFKNEAFEVRRSVCKILVEKFDALFDHLHSQIHFICQSFPDKSFKNLSRLFLLFYRWAHIADLPEFRQKILASPFLRIPSIDVASKGVQRGKDRFLEFFGLRAKEFSWGNAPLIHYLLLFQTSSGERDAIDLNPLSQIDSERLSHLLREERELYLYLLVFIIITFFQSDKKIIFYSSRDTVVLSRSKADLLWLLLRAFSESSLEIDEVIFFGHQYISTLAQGDRIFKVYLFFSHCINILRLVKQEVLVEFFTFDRFWRDIHLMGLNDSLNYKETVSLVFQPDSVAIRTSALSRNEIKIFFNSTAREISILLEFLTENNLLYLLYPFEGLNILSPNSLSEVTNTRYSIFQLMSSLSPHLDECLYQRLLNHLEITCFLSYWRHYLKRFQKEGLVEMVFLLITILRNNQNDKDLIEVFRHSMRLISEDFLIQSTPVVRRSLRERMERSRQSKQELELPLMDVSSERVVKKYLRNLDEAQKIDFDSFALEALLYQIDIIHYFQGLTWSDLSVLERKTIEEVSEDLNFHICIQTASVKSSAPERESCKYALSEDELSELEKNKEYYLSLLSAL